MNFNVEPQTGLHFVISTASAGEADGGDSDEQERFNGPSEFQDHGGLKVGRWWLGLRCGPMVAFAVEPYLLALAAAVLVDVVLNVVRALWRRRKDWRQKRAGAPAFFSTKRRLVLAGLVIGVALTFVTNLPAKIGLVVGLAGVVVVSEVLDYTSERKATRRQRPSLPHVQASAIEVMESWTPPPIDPGPELPSRELTREEAAWLTRPTERPEEPVTSGLDKPLDVERAAALGRARKTARAIRTLVAEAEAEFPPLPTIANPRAHAIWTIARDQRTLGRYMNKLHGHLLVAVDGLRAYGGSHEELDRLYRTPKNPGDLRTIAGLLEALADYVGLE